MRDEYYACFVCLVIGILIGAIFVGAISTKQWDKHYEELVEKKAGRWVVVDQSKGTIEFQISCE